MKRVLFLIIALFGLYSCSTFTEELDDVFEVSTPKLIESPVGGGTYEVEVKALCSYKLSCQADWVLLSQKEIKDAGTNKISINVKANGLATTRETKLLISNEYYGLSENITIKQAAAGAYINVSKNNLTASVVGETVQFKVSANVAYTLSSDASWCKLSTTKGSVGEDCIYYLNVESNPNLENRTANITISNSDYKLSQTITLVQNGAYYYISYTSTDKSVEPDLSMAGVSILEHQKTLNSNGEIDGLIIVDKPITTIVYGMFSMCSSLTSVTIPDSVTSIEDGAFVYCSNLTSITIPDSVTSIGENAFINCYSLTDIYVNITNLEAYAAGNVTYVVPAYDRHLLVDGTEITNLVIPDGVTSIGYGAFAYCSSLTSVTIPNSVTSIGDVAFYDCSSLTSVTIGNSVTSIGEGAFSDCSSLTSITIPDSVISIGDYAFGWCGSLTSVTIPDSVTSIGKNAFYGCSSLTSITIPDSVTSIGDYAFYGCSGLTSITIPDSVTSIGKDAFDSCIRLTSIAIPDSVTSIGKNAFYGCSSLKSVTIGNGVTSIGEAAFYGCSNLTSVTIPDSVTSIGSFAFLDCSSLTSVYCKATTPPTLGSYVFNSNASGRKFYVDVAVVEAYKAAASWSIYKSDIVTVYGEEYKLRYTSSNGKVVEPAYAYNTKPFNANIVSNTYENGEGVIIFDAPLTSIGYRAFFFCSTLTSVTIPETVISIGSAAFNGCDSLSKIYCKATTPPQGGYNMFYNTSENLKIYVPTNSVSAYKTPQFWSDYSSKIVGYNF